MSSKHNDPPFMLSSKEAAKFIKLSFGKRGIVYPKIGLFIISLILRFIPSKILNKMKY